LAAGTLVQIIEPSVFGLDTMASRVVTLSVEGLSSGTLNIAIGSVTGVITSGIGRRGVTLSLGAGDTGNVAVTLSSASGSITFARARLELGNKANSWVSRPITSEAALCQRYFWTPGATFLIDAFQAALSYSAAPLTLPVTMRAVPTVTFTVPIEGNINNGERNLAAQSTSALQFLIRAATQGRVYAQFSNILVNAEI
jgi:hypothetical protein